MLTLSNLSKSYGGRTLFRDASLQVNRGERIGLVGPNGAGKSTLFSLILRENSPDEGQVLLERGTALGYLPQESAPVGEESVLALATGSKADGSTEDGDDYTALSLDPKAKRILRGLAFKESDFDRPARTFSGGWVMRAHLARLLTQEPDLLMLDEPTNHSGPRSPALVPRVLPERLSRRDPDDLARSRIPQSTDRHKHCRDWPRSC